MSELKFKPSDFKSVTLGHSGVTPTIEEMAANIANARLAEMLKDVPVVYAKDNFQGKWFTEAYRRNDDTHQARLVDIREIEK